MAGTWQAGRKRASRSGVLGSVFSMRVLSIFGTRPEAIKMAPVVRELAQHQEVESHVCVTAQHREMLDQVLDLFQIAPDVDLNLMRPNQSLAELTARVFTHLDPVLEKIQPDWVLVQGFQRVSGDEGDTGQDIPNGRHWR